jgi:hypothetical protein
MESSINKSIVIASEPDEDINTQGTSFPDAVKELGKALLEKYPNKTSNLSNENINGLIQIDVLNTYMLKNFGYEYEVLNTLSRMKVERVVSTNGWGTDNLIKIIKGIQASFEQTELPNRLSNLLRR